MQNLTEEEIRYIVRDEFRRLVKSQQDDPRVTDKSKPPKGIFFGPNGMSMNSDRAAEYCGFRGGGQILRNFKHTGGGPRYEKHGRILVYLPSDLDDWMESRKDERKKKKAPPEGHSSDQPSS